MSEQDEFAFFQGMQSANDVLNETMPDHAERVRNYYRHQGRTAAIVIIATYPGCRVQ